jgi:hyperosmotically inducible protein
MLLGSPPSTARRSYTRRLRALRPFVVRMSPRRVTHLRKPYASMTMRARAPWALFGTRLARNLGSSRDVRRSEAPGRESDNENDGLIISAALLTAGAACSRDRNEGTARAAQPAAQQAPRDNTAVNARDRGGENVTAQDQSENATDRTLTQEVRKAIVADDSLSTNAKNVKGITIDGVVTLRRPGRQRAGEERHRSEGERHRRREAARQSTRSGGALTYLAKEGMTWRRKRCSEFATSCKRNRC